MTLYVNGFDHGTAGSAATTSSIASSGFGYTKGGATAATFSAVDTIDGALAIEIPRTSGSTLNIFTNGALSTLDVSFSFLFTYKTALPSSNYDYLFDVRTTLVSGGSLLRCEVNSGNHPFLQLSGANLGSAATGAFVAGTQYRCDGRIHVNGTTGSVHVDFYPATSATPSFTGFAFTSQNTGTAPIIDVYFGPSGSNTVASGTFVLDLCRIDDSQSSTYFGPNTAAVPQVSAGAPQTVNARGSVVLTATVLWAAGHTGTVAWTGGTTPITNATSLTATVADIGSPALTAGNPIKDDLVIYTLTATQDDSQVGTGVNDVTRVCGNRWILKGTKFVCAPLVRNR